MGDYNRDDRFRTREEDARSRDRDHGRTDARMDDPRRAIDRGRPTFEENSWRRDGDPRYSSDWPNEARPRTDGNLQPPYPASSGRQQYTDDRYRTATHPGRQTGNAQATVPRSNGRRRSRSPDRPRRQAVEAQNQRDYSDYGPLVYPGSTNQYADPYMINHDPNKRQGWDMLQRREFRAAPPDSSDAQTETRLTGVLQSLTSGLLQPAAVPGQMVMNLPSDQLQTGLSHRIGTSWDRTSSPQSPASDMARETNKPTSLRTESGRQVGSAEVQYRRSFEISTLESKISIVRTVSMDPVSAKTASSS